MDDFKVIARLLAAIRASEENPAFDTALVDEKVLRTTAVKRDLFAVKLQKGGYIKGLDVVNAVGNGGLPFVNWENSRPYVTLGGLTWMQTNRPISDAIKELKNEEMFEAAKTVNSYLKDL